MIRTGIGYDVHRFEQGRPLMLGGIEITHHSGLAGHSDADVALHALTDAILGAAGAGDIGEHFPPSDEIWKDADSGDLLRRSLEIIGDGWLISNADIVIMAEVPKIGPFREAMCERIATLLDVGGDQVNVKATTTEGLGFVGRQEGIAAMATATIVAREIKEQG